MIGTEAAIGLLLSLVTFLRSEVGGRKSKQELLAAAEDQNTVENYLAWLRRQDQEALIHQIEASKSALLAEVSSLGLELEAFSHRVLQHAGDLEGRLRELNERISPPVLSMLPLSTRPRVNLKLKGREREIEWLMACSTDAIVCGQPGSGKTELLQTLATKQNARFLVTSNPDEAVKALLANTPQAVIIDDAGTKADIILRLRHLRSEFALKFRLIAICWPFDKAILQNALEINETATLELNGLPRKLIAAIINEIATARGVKVNDDFIRVVVQQSRGMPGLAASLSLATIAAGGEALVSGEFLLRDLAPFLLRVVGPDTVQLLSAFACGGEKGIVFKAVAQNLGKEILQVMSDAQRVALAGVLEQTGKETLCVQPEFLRSALLKETFFPNGGLALPWKICEALITSAEDPVLGYLELIYARGRAGADVPFDRLCEIITHVNDYRLWDAMVWLDEMSCEWVVKSAPSLSTDIKRAALRYIPKQILPLLLGTAECEARPHDTLPEAEIGLLQEWVDGGWTDAAERRRMVFDSAIASLAAGGDPKNALQAVQLSFGLNYRETDSDPANPQTFRFHNALLSLKATKAVFEQWKAFLTKLSGMNPIPWPPVIAIIGNWLHESLHGDGLSEDYIAFLRSSTMQMIGDLLPLVSDNQAVFRWIYLHAQRLGMFIEPCPVNPEFMTLFPKERFGDNWEEIEEEQNRAAHELAITWIERPVMDIVEDLTVWEKQAEALGNVWPQKLSAFASKLAEIRKLEPSELLIVIRLLPAQAAIPFMEAAFAQARMRDEHLQQALERPELHGLLLHYTLTGKTPDLYSQLESQIPKWTSLVEALCRRGEANTEMLEKLLRHEDINLRRQVTLYMFRKEKGIPITLCELWRKVIIQSLIEFVGRHDVNCWFDFVELFAFDKTIAPAVLDGILSSGTQVCLSFHENLMSQLIGPLGKEERRAVIHRCKHLRHSRLPALLVGRDEDLYRELLNIPELSGCWNSVLVGDPNNDHWIALAKIALEGGFSHKDIAYAVDSDGYTCTGRLSTYYQQWVEHFERLRQNTDSDIQRIADEGLKWSVAGRDAERRKEKREEIYGWN